MSVNNTVESARKTTELRVGVDIRDPVLDNDKARQRISAMAAHDAPVLDVVFEEPLPPAFEGKLCWIWGRMAKNAVDAGAEYIVLLGDDVELLTPGWQHEVEIEFSKISTRTGLPLGAACVALRDASFPAFPTFPVVHRFHFETFGELFPDEFFNQHGDPFLFQLYRRFGAACFAPTASLRNTVGGFDDARYRKEDSESVWHGAVLSRAVEQLQAHLEPFGAVRIPCIDVVIPTFRCDLEALLRLTSVSFCEDSAASLSIVVVVDRPDTPNLAELRQILTSYAANRVVRVVTMPSNQGASMARNTGLAQSFGEHVIFLDDDVVPYEGLLDAYLSAILRFPDAAGYVGSTILPKAQTLVEHAICACHIAFFYDIAMKIDRPPWGVTANLCVSKRATNNCIWFDNRFPKTGGGEDVDFCLRLKQRGALVSVPAAKVLHPFWKSPFAQVAGWANGDVLCLESQPGSVFRAPPNWVEFSTCLLVFGYLYSSRSFLLEALVVVGVEVTMLFLSFVPETVTVLPWYKRAAAGALATIPPMIQDATRLYSKLRRGQLSQLFLLFDWMDGGGHGDHVPSTVLALVIKNSCYLLSLSLLQSNFSPALRSVLAVVLLTIMLGWTFGQRQEILSVPVAPLKPLKLKTTATPFVVLGCQRTGSNHLCGLLHHVGSIAMHNELFNVKGVFTHCGGVCTDLNERDACPGDLLDTAFSVKGEGHAVGFKLFPEHIRRSETHHDLFSRLLRDPAVKKIVLKRKSRLAVAVSSVRALVTGSYTTKNTGNLRVHIRPSDLQRFYDSYDAYYKFLDEMTVGQQILKISHEDVVANPEAIVHHICTFLGVVRGDSKLKDLFVKQSDRLEPDERDIVNYTELKRAFGLT
jgi:LPS sulfotransferase NodH/glycosyltransferase involved in cell wall biosynthesis